MNALLRILAVWRPHALRLLGGLLIAELSVCAGLLLMGQTGMRVGGAVLGVTAGFAALRFAGVSRIVLRYAERLSTHDAMFRALADLRGWFYRKLANGAAAGLEFRRAGDMLSRLVSDVQALDSLYLRILVPLAAAVLTLPVVAVIALRTGLVPGLMVSALFIGISVVLPWYAARFSRRSGPDIRRSEAALRVSALDFASGLREARAFQAEGFLTEDVTQRQETLLAAQRRRDRHMVVVRALARLMARLGAAVILCACAGIFLPQAPVLIGVTALFVVMTALDGVTDLPQAGLYYGDVVHAAERLAEIAERPVRVEQGDAPLPARHDLCVEHVSFGWSEARPAVLRDFSLTLRQGERAALIGPSGAGKSSLAALILKVAAPQQGRILFGGVDIRTLGNDALRGRIAWLSQFSHLFDDTIRGNLLLGRTDLDDDALWASLEKAQIADFVRTLPDGLDTWIGESGSRLSGGQGRRIALGRVLLSQAPVLILDEPATGLDSDTERAFLQTLNEVTQGRSVLLIAHRLTGVEKLDHIWRLQNGQAIPSPG